MNHIADTERALPKTEPAASQPQVETAFGFPRNFLENRFVYVVVSPRARGLSLGINLNPDKRCDFDCVYCEVNRQTPGRDPRLAIEVMARELEQTLHAAYAGKLRQTGCYRHLPEDLLQLRHVAFSGDGEPTLCPQFAEVAQAVVHVRARGQFPFFKMVLITNGSGLHHAVVQQGLKCFTRQDEVWAKLDAGTQAYMDQVNRPRVKLEQILANLLMLGRQRPVVIQSLFQMHQGLEPPEEELRQYVGRLNELREKGAQISLVQIYSATRPPSRAPGDHLPLKSLSRIAQMVRKGAGLAADVF